MQPSSLAEGAVPSTVTFTAPSTVAIETSFGTEGAFQVLELYSSPSRPGFCNHVGRMVVVKDRSGKMPGLLRTFSIPMPKWFNHILSSFFLNQVRSLNLRGELLRSQHHNDAHFMQLSGRPVSSPSGAPFGEDWPVYHAAEWRGGTAGGGTLPIRAGDAADRGGPWRARLPGLDAKPGRRADPIPAQPRHAAPRPRGRVRRLEPAHQAL